MFAYLRLLRPRQMTKNVFCFAGLIFSGRLLEPGAIPGACLAFAAFWVRELAHRRQWNWRTAWLGAVGFVTDFLDTLGISSFATTTSLYRLNYAVADEKIPGTLNVGQARCVELMISPSAASTSSGVASGPDDCAGQPPYSASESAEGAPGASSPLTSVRPVFKATSFASSQPIVSSRDHAGLANHAGLRK